ncbi:MAG TPA: histidine kinase [Bacteroidia bacterium]|nr:histidine kinase [Bacteroidia bacterium]
MGCIIFLSLPILFSPDLEEPTQLYKIPPFQRDFVGYLVLVIYFYLNYYVFITKYYFSKRYVLFATLTLLSFLVVSVIPNILIPDKAFVFHPSGQCIANNPSYPMPHGHESFFLFFSHHFFEFLIVCTLSLMLKISSQLKLAEQEKVNAELSYLKAQINPHFLFNTLNSIYSLAIEKSDYTATAVVKLSGMMRYVITDASHKFVALEKEINYISDYIELQKLRIDSTIKLTYSVTGTLTEKRIAPLVLISFIENAFKYGVNAEENSEINIHIDITKSYLHLRVFNKKVSIHQIPQGKSGLGIENAKNRLQLLYPGTHKLIITNNKLDYSIFLSLYLHD